jgi:hypothetical protein
MIRNIAVLRKLNATISRCEGYFENAADGGEWWERNKWRAVLSELRTIFEMLDVPQEQVSNAQKTQDSSKECNNGTDK